MSAERPWAGGYFFPRLVVYLAAIVNLAGTAALIILIIAEFIILVNNFQSYVARYGYRYPNNGYLGDYGCGYVEFTNAPKHLGSAVWTLLAQLGLIVFCALAIAGDLSWRNSGYNTYGAKFSEAFYATGITALVIQPFHVYYNVLANALLKVYIVVVYMSQSFYGLSGGTHSDPLRDGGARIYYTPGSSVNYDSAQGFANSQGNNNPWKRQDWGQGNGQGYVDNEPSHKWAYYGLIGDKTPIGGMEAFAYYMGWVIVATIPASVIAFMFLSAEWANRNQPKAAEKADG